MDPIGLALAIGGAAFALFAAAGSAVGIGIAARVAAGVLSQDPEKFGSLLIMVALPGTQGIYGFLAAFLVILKLKLLAGGIPSLTIGQGLQIFFACVPVGLVGYISAVHQGNVAAAGCQLVARRPEQAMKGVIYTAMVETYAILGLLATFLLLQGIRLG